MNFDVILPVYGGDHPEFFEEAVDSAMSNSAPPNKLIVVQDGPVPPPLAQRISKVTSGSGIDLMVQEKNRGLASALNFGLTGVRQDIVIRADADDINSKDRFRKIATEIKAGFDIVGSYIQEIEPNSRAYIAVREVPLTQEDILKTMPRRNPFNHMTVGYRTEAVIKVGGYPMQPLREDYALWALMAASGAKMKNIKECLVLARTGLAMYKRRGGLQYIKNEVNFQKFLVEHGVSSTWRALLFGGIRSAIFALPPSMRALFYENILRRSQ